MDQHTPGMPASDTQEQEIQSPEVPERPYGLFSKLLAMPLFYKVLIANSVIVVLGALAGTTITLHVAHSRPQEGLYIPLICLFATIGLLLSAVLNGLLLNAAFKIGRAHV